MTVISPPNGKPPISSKPPIDKKFSKQTKPRPIIETWLYKRKTVNKTNNIILTTINPKWQRYYCLLMKDHILFQKQPDDRTPKEFIILKNFTIKKTTKKCSFMLIDHTKTNIEHEFYADSLEDFRDWWQNLSELNVKLNSANLENISLQSQSPILFHNSIKTDNSSRESSPLGSPSIKMPSRDSSPSLAYRKYFYFKLNSIYFINMISK